MSLRLLLLVLLLTGASSSFAQGTTLVAGDIAFTGYNSDDNVVNGLTANDDFSFMLLRNIVSGTTIYFTDFGWAKGVDITGFQTAAPCGTSSGALSDGILMWSSTENMTYGSQVFIRCKQTPTANKGTLSLTQATYNSSVDYLNLATGGDQILAYQGSISSPILIAGFSMNGAWDATLGRCTFTSGTSTRPTALDTASCALAIIPEVDNARIKSTVVLTGDAKFDRANIHNAINWDVDDGTAFALPAAGLVFLPVNFISFSGKKEPTVITLEWMVGKEQHVKYYQVSKSLDGIIFSPVGSMDARGHSMYRWVDRDVTNSHQFYRIAAVDFDGTSKYSQVLNLTAELPGWKIKLSPNPVSTFADLSLALPTPEEIHIRVLDTRGTVISEQKADYTKGFHSVRIPLTGNVKPGFYIVQLRFSKSGQNLNRLFVKQ